MDDVWCHPEPLDLWRFQREFNDGIVEMAITTNGHVLAHHPRLADLVDEVRKEGITQARLSLHGMEATHDWFVGSPGAYTHVTEAAKRLVDHGLWLGWNLFLSKANTKDVREMIDVLRSLTTEVDPFINVTVPTLMSNRRLMEYEAWCPDVHELEAAIEGISGNVALPGGLCEGSVTRNVPSGEHDLTEMAKDHSAYRRRGAYVSVTCDGQLNVYEGSPANYEYCHGNLASDGISRVMDSVVSYRTHDLPSIGQLCSRYGDPASAKAHPNDVSVMRKWLALYRREERANTPSPAGIDPDLHALAWIKQRCLPLDFHGAADIGITCFWWGYPGWAATGIRPELW